jgi:hypothetical protein
MYVCMYVCMYVFVCVFVFHLYSHTLTEQLGAGALLLLESGVRLVAQQVDVGGSGGVASLIVGYRAANSDDDGPMLSCNQMIVGRDT